MSSPFGSLRFIGRAFFAVCLVSVSLLAGCDEQPPTTKAAAAFAGQEVTAEVVVDEPTLSSAVVGIQGGTLRLTHEVGAVYSIEYRDGGAWIQGVALLRGTNRGWYNDRANEAPLALRNVGIGGSLGPHMVVVTPDADGIWLDDKLFVAFQDHNVALFDGAGVRPHNIGLASLDAYLGPAPLTDIKQRKALVQQRLRALLMNSKSIQALWADS